MLDKIGARRIVENIVWWCYSYFFQVSEQTVHHKQEVDLKHCKTEHLV